MHPRLQQIPPADMDQLSKDDALMCNRFAMYFRHDSTNHPLTRVFSHYQHHCLTKNFEGLKPPSLYETYEPYVGQIPCLLFATPAPLAYALQKRHHMSLLIADPMRPPIWSEVRIPKILTDIGNIQDAVRSKKGVQHQTSLSPYLPGKVVPNYKQSLVSTSELCLWLSRLIYLVLLVHLMQLVRLGWLK